jgi:hypothetical protein
MLPLQGNVLIDDLDLLREARHHGAIVEGRLLVA